MIPRGARLSLSPHIAEIGAEHSAIVMRLDSADCEPLQLTGSALLVWQSLRAGANSVEETVAQCALQTGTATEALEADVAQFIARLVDLGLLAAD